MVIEEVGGAQGERTEAILLLFLLLLLLLLLFHAGGNTVPSPSAQ